MNVLLGLYWGPRDQSLDDCASLCLSSLTLLSGLGFDSWYQKGRTRKEALSKRVATNPETIQKLLEAGVNRTDIGKKVIKELGFSMSLWSGGNTAESYSMSVRCGGYSKQVSNNFLLSLPPTGKHSFQSSEPQIRTAFAKLVSIWAPDKAVLCDSNTLAWENGNLASSVQAFERYP